MRSIAILLITLLFSAFSKAKTCSYSTYKWNTPLKKAVELRQVTKPYSELTANEIDPRTGCSICSEDQTKIEIDGVPFVTVCKAIASKLKEVLLQTRNRGFPIVELVGYRVGKTKGKLDKAGNRTQFSNHSFGTAIDINPLFNGLYDQCMIFNQNCRLIKGGIWDTSNIKSIQKNSFLVNSMLEIGLKWGGNITGNQKDFMHFSFSGY